MVAADEDANSGARTDPEKAVLRNVRSLLRRRREKEGGNPEPDVASDVHADDDTDLYADLELDSLEAAELSVALEDELGDDPYSQGLAPRTVAEVVEFYDK